MSEHQQGMLFLLFGAVGLAVIWFVIDRVRAKARANAKPWAREGERAIQVDEAEGRERDAPKRSSYFVRHWRGDLPLGVSYWVNGTALGLVLRVVFSGVDGLSKQLPSLRASAAAALGIIGTILAVNVWQLVGIWRSSDHHSSRGGSSGWAGAAKASVILSILALIGTVPSLGPRTAELARLAFGVDPISKATLQVSKDGRSVLLSGFMGAGSAEDIRLILKAAGGIRVVQLDSGGGRLFEAQQIAEEIRRRKLGTYVDGLCLSACTIVLLAGADRGATPNAKIGFHGATFGNEGFAEGTAIMLDSYRAIGVSDEFLARVSQTSGDDMWYPTRDELIQNHIVTRVSLGGETAAAFSRVASIEELREGFRAVPLWQSIEARFPEEFEHAIQAAWAASQSGATDGEVATAARSIVSSLVPRALATASDRQLERFQTLMVAQLAAALAVSPEACRRFLAGELDAQATFPKELLDDEESAMRSLFAEPAVRRPPPSSAAAERAIALALRRLTKDQIRALNSPQDSNRDQEFVCNSLLAYHRSIKELPTAQRQLALRGMYQSPP